tara:strand:- start:554 stop:766 length:213 start_codon:yes stop_codon:yes gene_type:complete
MPQEPDEINPFLETLAELSGMTVQEVRNTLKELERIGAIDIDRTGNRAPVVTLSKDAKCHAEQLIKTSLD